jgi:predicted nucleic acid-binding protein
MPSGTDVAHYIDTSALVKLVTAESESLALRSWIHTDSSVLVSSDLARAELLRTVRRAAPNLAVRTRAVLDSITLMVLTTATFEAAGILDPTILRTVDAVHVAAALEPGGDLDGLVTYDQCLADAARSNGIAVVAPNPPAP